MNKPYFVFMMLPFGAWISSCGLTTERIQIGYQPQEVVAPVAGPNQVRVAVDVSDLRSNKEELSKKGDEYSFLAPILAENDVAEVLKEAIRSELQRRGFVTNGVGTVVVRVELSKFYNQFVSSRSEAELFMHVQVQKPGEGLRVFDYHPRQGCRT